MGARTDQAERRVVEQREKISRMLSDLENRVRDDADEVKGRVAAQASHMSHQVTDRIPGTSVLHDQVYSHPLTSVAGAFSVGIALGMLSEGFGGEGSGSSSSGGGSSRGGGRGDRGRQDDGGGLLGGPLVNQLTSVAMSVIGSPARDEIQKAVRQTVQGFFDQGRARPSGGGGASGQGSSRPQPSQAQQEPEQQREPQQEQGRPNERLEPGGGPGGDPGTA